MSNVFRFNISLKNTSCKRTPELHPRPAIPKRMGTRAGQVLLDEPARKMNSHVAVSPSVAGPLNSVVRIPALVHDPTQCLRNVLAVRRRATYRVGNANDLREAVCAQVGRAAVSDVARLGSPCGELVDTDDSIRNLALVRNAPRWYSSELSRTFWGNTYGCDLLFVAAYVALEEDIGVG